MIYNIPFLDLSPSHSLIEDQLKMAFNDTLKKCIFVLGDNVSKFENEYAQFNNTKFSVGLSNGLDALILCLKTLNIGPGDEVIVPSNTYIATVLAVSHVGATPVFAEPDESTFNITSNSITKVISNKTKALMPVHLYGQACKMDDIMELAEKNNLFVIEDNAQGHGASFNNKITGSWGHLNATSFYPGKNLGALGDGGAITTNSIQYADAVKLLRNYGSSVKYQNDVIGFNNRLDELQAAFLTIKLKYLKEWTSERQKIASWYNELLKGVGDIVLPLVSDGSTHVYHLYVIKSEHRDDLQEYLKFNGIGTLIHYPIPPHLQKAYMHLGYKKGDFPVSEKLSETTLSLPMWPGLTFKQISIISEFIKNYFTIKK
jgi:dTDP-4-amino-4,6-dideoxygalactose transaminase